MAGGTSWNIPPSVVVRNINLRVRRATKKWLRVVASDVLLEINRRVAKGRNAFNKPFRAYSPATIQKKKKEGKSTRVNLQDTSSMIQSLMVDDSRVDAFEIKIGVKGVDFRGISNSYKAFKLHHHKNYQFLLWTRSYKLFVGKRKKLLIDFI